MDLALTPLPLKFLALQKEHLARHPESFVSALRGWRGREWLMEQRQSHLPLLPHTISRLTSVAGLTGTRILATRPQKRWHDGVEFAR